jgi:flagellar hook-associated protein 1 FlgK
MISSFNGLNTALRGLLANQRALDVTSHNIGNANTVGYTRQEAVFAAAPSLELHAGATQDGYGAQLGQGVDVLAYRRLRDDFLDLQWRAQNMALGEEQASAQRLGQAEDVLGESGTGGLGALLDKFWSAWQDLANHPESSAARAAVVAHGQTLAQAFGTLDADLGQVAADATAEANGLLGPQGPVQAAAKELAALNLQISNAVKNGYEPNDLLDRRDLLLDTLSQYGQVSVTRDPAPANEGMVIVSFGGAATPLVQGTTATPPAVADLNNPGGRIGALLRVANVTIPGYRAALDAMASQLATAVNGIHAGFFSGATAATLAVAVAPGAVQAGTGGSGDSSIALAIGRLRGGAVDQGYAALVQQVGGDVASAERAQDTAEAVVGSLTERRASVAGVSMDEEMTNMMRFQRGYQAAARAMTTMDDALDTLINRMGRVGL